MASNSNEKPEEKNWNDLTPEMKLECIDRMDFVSRWHLRSTSSTEKQLVESRKCLESKLSIGNPYTKDMIIRDPPKTIVRLRCTDMAFELAPTRGATMTGLLKMATTISYLKLDCDTKIFEAVRDMAEETNSLPIESFFMVRASKNDISVLNKCTGLEYVEIDFRRGEKTTFAYFLKTCEPILLTRQMKLKNVDSVAARGLIYLIKRWIANNQCKSSRLVIALSRTIRDSRDLGHRVSNEFKDRISNGDYASWFHIKMDNENFIKFDAHDRQVLLEVVDYEMYENEDEDEEEDW